MNFKINVNINNRNNFAFLHQYFVFFFLIISFPPFISTAILLVFLHPPKNIDLQKYNTLKITIQKIEKQYFIGNFIAKKRNKFAFNILYYKTIT